MSLELSDKIATIEMSVTQVGITLSAVHIAIKENEAWLAGAPKDTEQYAEVEEFNKLMNDIAYNLATVLDKAMKEESE